MDVYDFDGTLYRGDSTADFTLWCLRRFPRVASTLPRTALAAAGMGLRALNRTQMKAQLYRYLPLIPDIEREAGLFWATHEKRIGGPCDPQPGDLVISAGPDFLLRDVCERRGLELIASLVDPLSGKLLTPNCQGAEKVVRFRAVYPAAHVRRFYSDSYADTPMAQLADEAFKVNIPRNSLTPWKKP